ncbi:phytoene dehydrogenase [Ophiocordyceps camponoti-floridani]|uniref:Phytoene desaturase n=1 Tax=Ophiocordyceps camponoti-floridani TaxID=2030778 RepID=A0A8H4VG79_9HYPO|nr:phytoene dehydrogenase [Ophiocordyceps camponoti-floridani]
MIQPTAIVIGAGAGGVATAARLAQRGFRVTVVEKNEFTGGRCSLIHRDGYRFDQGPSLLLMPEIFHQTFRELGTSLAEEGVHLFRCQPNYCVWFSDNDCFQLSTDLADLATQIERHEGSQGIQGLLSFLRESGRHYDISIAQVLYRNFPSLRALLRSGFLLNVGKMHPFESNHHRVSRYFKSDKMRRVFTFASMYLGMSPFDAPGTYSLLQYTELMHGVSYPEGGFQKVLDALVKIGQRNGVEYRLGTPVSKILISNDKTAGGVQLKSGQELHADVVIVNADLVWAYNNLLPPSPYASRLQTRDASCSSLSYFWSFDRLIPELKGHNVFLAEEYRQSFDAIFKRHTIPDEPSFYVNVPSRIDASAAPPGKDAVVVLVPIGHLDGAFSQVDMDRLVASTRDFVLDTIETRTGARGLRESLIRESVDTPLSWESKFNLDRGAILGLSHSFFNVLSFRPGIKHDSIDRLYFVGASTHPGTGVPVCLAGSKIQQQQQRKYDNSMYKSSLLKRSNLDMVNKAPLISTAL